MTCPREHRPLHMSAVGLVRILDVMTQGLCTVSALGLCLLLAVYLFEVVARYLFDVPTSWSYDLGTWFLAISIMGALPDVTRRKANISIDFLLEHLRPHHRRLCKNVICVVACGFCLAAAGICLDESLRQFHQRIETNWINPIPKWWVSAIIPVGFFLCGLQFLRSFERHSTPCTGRTNH